MPHPVDTATTADGCPLLSLRPPIYSLNLDAPRVSDKVREHHQIEIVLERDAAYLYGSRTSLQLCDAFQSRSAAFERLANLYEGLAEVARGCGEATHAAAQEAEGEAIAAAAEQDAEDRYLGSGGAA